MTKKKNNQQLIHPTAIISDDVVLGKNVRVGAYSVLSGPLSIGDDTQIEPHVVIKGRTVIGKNNHIYQFASVGEDPQDKKYHGEDTVLEIGDNNVIRECVTLNRGTLQGGGKTVIGHHNLIMAYVHVAHDCIIGNHVILSNNTALAGHVNIHDYAILGGYSLVHQFCTIGSYCFTAMNSVISKDVPPYLMIAGHMAKPHGLNTEGLKRNQFSLDDIKMIKQAYQILYRSHHTTEEAIELLTELAEKSRVIVNFVDFLQHHINRGVIR